MNTKKLLTLGLSALLLIALLLAGGCGKKAEEAAKPTEEERVEEKPAPTGEQNDANSGGDVSADLESPYAIDYGEWEGTLTEDDDKDAYGIKWNPGDTIEITVIPSKGLDVQLNCFAGSLERYINDNLKGEQETFRETSDFRSPDKRISMLIERRGGSGDYTLKITKTPQNDANSGRDAGTHKDENAVVISAGTYQGYVGGSDYEYSDYEDMYRINLEEGQKAVIKVIPSSDLDVAIYTGDGHDETNDNFKGEPEEVTQQAPERYWPFFWVGRAGGYRGTTMGTYTLEISIE